MNRLVLAKSLLVFAGCCFASGLLADESKLKLASQTERFFLLPAELEVDSGAANGDAAILRVAPLYGSPSEKDWKIIHLNQFVLADAPGGVPGQPGNPESKPGEKVFGLSDMLHASFFTPPTTGKVTWGFGAMLSIPIATDDSLGSGKWSAGPAFRIVYRSGPWNVGMFGGQLWSFAGSSNRADISQLIVRGAIRRQLPNDWYFVSAPIITANWNSKDQRWKVPLGGGLGKVVQVFERPWAVSLQGYYNAIKPDGAPDWSVRLSVTAPLSRRK